MMKIFEHLPASNIVLVHSYNPQVMLKLALVRPWLKATHRSAIVDLLQQLPLPAIAGTVARGRKGWRIYLAASYLKSGNMTFDQIVAHERWNCTIYPSPTYIPFSIY